MNSLILLDSQFFFMMLHQLIRGTPLVYSVYLKGSINCQLFETAVKKLITINPVLQFTFDWPETASSLSEFTTKKLNLLHLPISWENLLGQDTRDQEIQISQEIDYMLNHQTPLNSSSLYSFKVFELNSDSFCVIMSIHHVICDGLSGISLIHQLLRYLTEESNLPTNPLNYYNEVVEQINQYHPTEKCLSLFKSENAKSKKQSFQWNPNRSQLQPLTQHFSTIRTNVDRITTQKLIHLTEHLKVSLYSIIVATYIRFLFSTGIHDTIILTLPTSGKLYPHADALDLVGCFAQAVSLEFERSIIEQPIENIIQATHHRIQLALLSEFDLIQNQVVAQNVKSFKLKGGEPPPLTKVLFRNAIKSNFYISFTGYSPLQKQYGNLQILDYKEATFNNPGVSDWMHTIFLEELYIFANYDTLFFSQESIQTALLYVKDQLCHIANYYNSSLPLNIKIESSLESSVCPLHDYLLVACATIGIKHIDRSHICHDLEAQLGLDSLSRIRLISKINKDYPGKVSKNTLFMCRTLDEFAKAIQKGINV